MKKVLALLLALAMVFACVACSKDDKEAAAEVTTVEVSVEAPDWGDDEEEEIVEEVVEATEVVEVTGADGEAVTDEKGEVVTEVEAVTDASGEKVTEVVTEKVTKAPASVDNVANWSSKDILNYYNAAVIKTDPNAPAGNSKMVLSGEITGDGAIGAILKVLSPAAKSALEKNSTPTNFIPGYGEIKPDDVTGISVKDNKDTIIVEMTIKDQTDGSDADDKAGPVGRAIGTLGSIDGALKELGAEITEGRDTVKLTYTDVTIRAEINKKSGLITAGQWHYLVKINIGDAKAKLGISANLKNLKAAVDYTVVI